MLAPDHCPLTALSGAWAMDPGLPLSPGSVGSPSGTLTEAVMFPDGIERAWVDATLLPLQPG